MKVLIIGSGGREHALCVSIKNSKNINKIFCIPGNAGTAKISLNINIDINNFEEIKNFVLKEKIDIVIVGPEKPLVDGIVDYLNKFNIRVFGPNKFASQLEGSKIFTKKICEKKNIPTANFGIFQNKEDSFSFIEKCDFPIVIKADGLASGKGVYICDNKEKSKLAINEIFNGKFGNAEFILIEEFLDGEEMSFFVISDGKNIKTFGTAQDHKRALEGDKGNNTGGMGAYSPSRLHNKLLEDKIIEKIIKPTLEALKENQSNFMGFLYAGLMIIDNEPFLIEYNVRMGDPECQTILPKLKTDFLKLIDSCINGKLNEINIEWYDDKSLCIVLCSKGYPDKFEKNIELDLRSLKLNKDDFLFHAGTQIKDSKIYSTGGRVLNIVVKSNDFSKSRTRAIEIIDKISWENGFYRKDIGHRVIKE